MKETNLRNFAKDYAVPIIRPESYELLKQIVVQCNPKHILEIGTAIGFSGLCFLQNSNGDLTTIEHNKTYAKLALKNFKDNKVNCRVKLILGDCLVETAKMVANQKYKNYFDFIFLDGPKAQYDALLDSLVFLLKPGGDFVADNVLFRGYTDSEVAPPTKRFKTLTKRLENFIEHCKNNPKLQDFELKNIEDGMIFAKKKEE